MILHVYTPLSAVVICIVLANLVTFPIEKTVCQVGKIVKCRYTT